MIPKKIHYCWFGGNSLPKDVQIYIETWKKFCPDYEIKEWNEQNFDINANQYVMEAYHQKKWAFVSDVARITALYQEGGIYLDTDVEIIRSLDSLLNNQLFLGFEGTKWVGTNIIGAVKGHPLLKKFLDDYKSRSFINKDGSLDLTTNVEKLTLLLIDNYGIEPSGKEQQSGDIHIYPTDYFSPYDYIQGKVKKTNNTYSIHWFTQSWIKRSLWKKKLSIWYHRLCGIKMK